MISSYLGPLTRRSSYSQHENGQFYEYSYYRGAYRQEIAEDCKRHCVYCGLHEDALGGGDVMQIDHFRPHGIPRFFSLKNDPKNFNHACPRCNLLKKHHWPCDGDASHDGLVGFVDAFGEVREDFFSLGEDGGLIALRGPASYMINLLQLNRPHLKALRRLFLLRGQIDALLDELDELKDEPRPWSDGTHDRFLALYRLVRVYKL